MKKFISISTFQKLYSSRADLLTPEGLALFIERLNSEDGVSICQSELIQTEDFNNFLETLEKQENILFYGWVEQNQSLLEFVTKSELTTFHDKERHLEHKFSDNYKKFISPFLSNQLLKYQGEKELNNLEKVFSFVQLLDTEHRSVLENQLVNELMLDVKNVTTNAKSITDEQVLIETVKPLMDERIMAITNSLSKASYGFKVGYIDDILKVLKMKACTPRFANWILKRLEKIELNKEHEYKIIDLRNELISGELEVRNHGKKKFNFRIGTVAMIFLIIGIAGLVGYIIYYKPHSDVEETPFINDTSFMQFSKEERLKIDSLLIAMNGESMEDELRIDQGIPLIGDSDDLTIRNSYDNPTLERIYKDMIQDAENREDTYRDSCDKYVSFQQITGTTSLENRKANVETMIKNESDYDAILIVSENRKNGSTFSMMLPKNETKTFEINRYNYLKIIPGNHLQKFKQEQDALIDQPSPDFKQQFCDIDFNYREGINTDYQLMHLNSGRTKILLMGDLGGTFKVIDIKSVFVKH